MTAVLVVACRQRRITPECLPFHEMCRHLGELGFRCADLFDVLYREKDRLFWQMDLLFLRADRPEFATNQYR